MDEYAPDLAEKTWRELEAAIISSANDFPGFTGDAAGRRQAIPVEAIRRSVVATRSLGDSSLRLENATKGLVSLTRVLIALTAFLVLMTGVLIGVTVRS